MTVKCEPIFPLPLPDDPRKWDGWSKYKSPNLYERLCLDPRANPSNELIEEHCRELLRWWQKKLPLKNQPSNPLAQLLRPGLDESSRYLTQARVELLDPERRRVMDGELAARAEEEAVAEFHKYLTFAIVDGLLTPAQEKNLLQFGAEHGLSKEKMLGYIEAELSDSGAKRGEGANGSAAPRGGARPRRRSGSLNPRDDFARMVRLSGLDSDSMTDDQRDAFVNMAENLGLDLEEAENIIDAYLDEADNGGDSEAAASAFSPIEVVAETSAEGTEANGAAHPEVVHEIQERAQFINYQNSLGGQMLFIPSGQFVMGSETSDAA